MKRVMIGALLFLVARPVAQPSSEALTDMDRLRIQVVQLMNQVAVMTKEADGCRGQLAEPRATVNFKSVEQALTDTKTAIEKAHPGYTWKADTGELVKIEAALK